MPGVALCRRERGFFYPAVIGNIGCAFCEITEHFFHINDSTDREPECTDDGKDRRYNKIDDQEIMSPIFQRPGRKDIPDRREWHL